ncbi:MAG: transposase [Sedimentisphaerales bacterium]|nr:transposase [Sedimentisphaerales bacterium]
MIEALGQKITATNEPRRQKCGAPDYIVSRRRKGLDQTIGYVEAKDIGTNLTQAAKSEQIKKRYLPSLNNFILTDYIEFRWYVNGEKQLTAKLAEESAGKFKAIDKGEESVRQLWNAFLSQKPEEIKFPKELAEKMAHKAQMMRDIIKETFRQEQEAGTLHGQFEAFREVLLHDLTEEQFADMYAQTICYGLFSARCHIDDMTIFGRDKYASFHGMDDRAGELTREHAAYLLPKTNPFFRDIFGDIAGPKLDDRIVWLVDDLVELLRQADMGVILREFARRKKRRDPVVHFYETFLAQYNPKLKKARGVYYTPDEVVSYIVRSVDILLKEKFGLKQGLADKSKIKIPAQGSTAGILPAGGNSTPGILPAGGNSTAGILPAGGNSTAGVSPASVETTDATSAIHRCLILDPAVGTGTFLFEVIEQIHRKFKRQKGTWSDYVKNHLLPRLFGFELMMSPYAVAHMKLGLQLAETGYDFAGDERLGIYLTNTLEEAEETSRTLFAQYLSQEARAANKIKKDLPIMVVTGNPPYAGLSANMNKWIDRLLKNKLPGKNGAQSYYEIDGQPLGEKKVWLQDDYVKFIRFGQLKIEQTGFGILAFITNHGYLDNPTFRGMRQSLMQTFDEIYVLDLHGSTKKKETCPDGSPDKNVFDIQQGVSIGIFVKKKDNGAPAKVYHADLYGLRKGKYEWLTKNDIKTTAWNELSPNSPYYFFVRRDESGRKEYENFTKINDIFPVNVTGIVTARDKFAIDFDKKPLLNRIRDFCDLDKSDREIQDKYKLSENYAWRVGIARKELAEYSKTNPKFTGCLKKIHYRPFDERYIFYHPSVVWRTRDRVMHHMLAGENLGFGATRSVEIKRGWEHIICTREMIQHHSVSLKEVNCLFPLYLYRKGEKNGLFEHLHWPEDKGGRIPNLSPEFVDKLAGNIKLKFVSDGKGDLGTAGVSPAGENSTAGILPAVGNSAAGVSPAVGNSAAKMAAVQTGARGLRWRDRGYLPHWEKRGGIYHVTFRSADSLPKKVLAAYQKERDDIIQRAQQLKRELTEAETNRLKQLYSDRIETYLDSGKGQCYLQRPEIAEMIAKSLSHFDEKRYRLYAWCIMPNHVHVVVEPLAGYELSKILHSWKSYAANKANRLLSRHGVFWQREYYDHLIRNEDEFYHTIQYVQENPRKAGLADWKWVCIKSTAGILPAVGNSAASISPAEGNSAASISPAEGNSAASISPAEGNSAASISPTGENSAAKMAAVQGTFGPEDVFHYIYAVFHSPEYRKRYAEFLKIDFPRVPMPEGKVLFRKLCATGEKLVKLHLMEADILEDQDNWTDFDIEGSGIVEKGYPKYVVHADRPQKGKVYINADQYFEGVKPDVYEFHIGGYQVCEKWLKDRRERKLSYEDITHYQKIVLALGETIRLMNEPCLSDIIS